VFSAFPSREVTLGQMHKIGIHFIIYQLERALARFQTYQIVPSCPFRLIAAGENFLYLADVWSGVV